MEQQNMIMPFGKYKGVKLEDVPRGYLTYLYDHRMINGKLKDAVADIIPYLRKK
ncbi:MAG: DUF3820 family protein [Filimonas sp.]|nr:DUF3820 family protein [Filimonas sp.]